MWVIDVRSLAEFDAAVSELSTGGRQLLYRGQTRDYGTVIPSALRPNVKLADPKIERFFHLFLESAIYQHQAEFYASIYYKPSARDFYGLMQHYWFRTEYLDVTYEPHIALWFATNELVALNGCCCKYVSAEMKRPAVVYVFDPVDHLQHLESSDDFEVCAVDLAVAMDGFGWFSPTRLAAQKAALLTGASHGQRDLSRHVWACLQIHADIKRDLLWPSLAERYSVESLFYASDYFYEYLMFFNRTYLNETLVLIENKWMNDGIERFWEEKAAEELAEERPRSMFRPSAPWL